MRKTRVYISRRSRRFRALGRSFPSGAGRSSFAAIALALTLSLSFVTGLSTPSLAATEYLSIATGTTGGVYFPVGGAMAEIWNRYVDGIEATSEATGASVENLRLIDAGESQVGIVQGDVAYDAYLGNNRFEGRAIESNVLVVGYPNVYHAVSLESVDERLGLNCYGDVSGSRFSVGPPGSGNENSTNLVFEALGMSFDDIRVQRLSYAETARALREGRLDAGSWVVGLGHASLTELGTTEDLHLIPICDDELEKVTSEYPFYTPFTIPGGTYPGIDDGVETITLWNVITVSPDMPEELAYELARTLFEHVHFIEQVYPPGAPYFTPENLLNSPIPLHPGVIRYAREQGVEIPDRLLP